MEREAAQNCRVKLLLGVNKHLMLAIAGFKSVELVSIVFKKLSPGRLMVPDNRGDNLVSLREVIVHMDMTEPLRHTTPSIYLLLRQFINIVADLLMGNEHKMEL